LSENVVPFDSSNPTKVAGYLEACVLAGLLPPYVTLDAESDGADADEVKTKAKEKSENALKAHKY
jgi:hypothetical protein